MTLNLRDHAAGLDTERLQFYGKLVNEMYGLEAELRRIPNDDPIRDWAAQQVPPHEFGIWERNVSATAFGGILSNWAFTFPANAIDDRIIARLIEADMRRGGADQRTAKYEAQRRAKIAGQDAEFMRKFEERREEMVTLGKMAEGKTTIRHRINGEDVIIGDEVRSVRSFIV